MSKFYNIPLANNFLEEIACFIEHLENNKADLSKYCIFLPNKRSCRVLKQYILNKFKEKTTYLPQICVISDAFGFDSLKITFVIAGILKRKNKNISINTIFELAESMSSLIKELILCDVDYDRLSSIVPEHLLEYWGHTVSMIQECMQCSEIKNAINLVKIKFLTLMNAIANRDVNAISAGIDNTNSYTLRFLQAVSASEDGIIFLTGSEQEKSHNQISNVKLMETLNVTEINNIDYNRISHNEIFSTNSSRIKFAEFSSLSEEAFAIATFVRKSVFEKKSVLIVAVDANLSSKIKAELQRWNIIADDSYGLQFSKTRAGMLTATAMDVIDGGFKTSDTLNLLKFNRKHSAAVAQLELLLRRKEIIPKYFFEALSFVKNETYFSEEFIDFLDHIRQNALCYDTKTRDFSFWFNFTKSLVKAIDMDAAAQLEQISSTFIDHSYLLPQTNFEEYRIFLKNHIITSPARPSGYTDGVVMLGVIEAQLLESEVVIIAGANESSIIASEQHDFWMNKSMLYTLKLQTNEAKNDFIQCILERLTAKLFVVITRSKIIGGIQQQRCAYIDKIDVTTDNFANFERLDWLETFVKCIHKQHRRHRINFIAPTPGLCHRPNKFSVTDIELLKNNPYAFYAKKILRLTELNYIGETKNIRGNYVHKVLDEFIKCANDKNDEKYLFYIAQNILKNMQLGPSDFGIWFFRIKGILSFVVANADNKAISLSEVRGKCLIEIHPEYSCTISCIADRIDLMMDGSISIIDYKTGIAPSKKQIENGRKPQLAIEAIVAQNGGLQAERKDVSSLCIWQLSGSKNGGTIHQITKTIDETNALADRTLVGLRELINKYNVLGIPYDINADYEYAKCYAHLGRAKELFDD